VGWVEVHDNKDEHLGMGDDVFGCIDPAFRALPQIDDAVPQDYGLLNKRLPRCARIAEPFYHRSRSPRSLRASIPSVRQRDNRLRTTVFRYIFPLPYTRLGIPPDKFPPNWKPVMPNPSHRHVSLCDAVLYFRDPSRRSTGA
jgi:hypothetical protein